MMGLCGDLSLYNGPWLPGFDFYFLSVCPGERENRRERERDRYRERERER